MYILLLYPTYDPFLSSLPNLSSNVGRTVGDEMAGIRTHGTPNMSDTERGRSAADFSYDAPFTIVTFQ